MTETKPDKGKPKRRVSHRKELAVVTLAMVASISGVGGLLAANQPVTSQTTHPASISSTTHTNNGGRRVQAVAASWHGGERGERDDDGGKYAFAKPKRNVAPSFTPRSNTTASSVSQGS